MTVHDIEMQPVGPSFFAGFELLGEVGEIGGEEAWSNADGLGAGSHGRDHTRHRRAKPDVTQTVLMLEFSERMLAVTACSGGTANLFGTLWAGFGAAKLLGQTAARKPREQATQNDDACQCNRRLEPSVRHQANPDGAGQQNPEPIAKLGAEPAEQVASQARSEGQQQREPEEPRAEQDS
jgi:hypothetical protein